MPISIKNLKKAILDSGSAAQLMDKYPEIGVLNSGKLTASIPYKNNYPEIRTIVFDDPYPALFEKLNAKLEHQAAILKVAKSGTINVFGDPMTLVVERRNMTDMVFGSFADLMSIMERRKDYSEF